MGAQDVGSDEGRRKVNRALLSVSDKKGVVELASGLADLGVELLSTGGTCRVIAEAGIPVTDVSDYTGFPIIMDHRVATLHPKVHGGILCVRDKQTHMQEADEHGILMIDMIINNLYPFKQTIQKDGVTLEEAVENIDVGGPAMLRAAAKNHKYVAVVCNPDRYEDILRELRSENYATELSLETRQQLALEAFAYTGQYDAEIDMYLGRQFGKTDFPKYMARWFTKEGSELRYGENPHQKGAVYSEVGAAEQGIAKAVKLSGTTELSFNNYLDLAAAMNAARDFDEPTAIIIKHLNPCGAASAPTLWEAFANAWAADPISAFGSVLGFNRTVDVETAEMIGNSKFLSETIVPEYQAASGDYESEIIGAFVEAIIAPGYEPEALEILKRKTKMRIMLQSEWSSGSRALEFKDVPGGVVIQTPDVESVRREDLVLKTIAKPSSEQIDSLLFADKIAKHVKSNAIVLVQGKTLVGCGAGQMSRVESCIIAGRKAGQRARGSVLASDAMFPSADGLEAAALTGAVAVIQPGGSQKDEEVIAMADDLGVAMAFSGMRHFWH